jgi:hypothetical protein
MMLQISHPDEIKATKISLGRLGRQTHTETHADGRGESRASGELLKLALWKGLITKFHFDSAI